MLKHQQTRNPSAFLTPTKIRWLTLAIGLVWYALSSAVHAQTSYTVTDLGTLGGDTSVAFSINNRGDVVGISVPFNSVFYHAFLYSGGQMQDLGTLGGESSEAFAINNRGDVVGFYSVPINGNPNDFINHAFLYSRGKIQELIAAFSFATDISNRGEITGAYLIRRQSPQDIIHAFLYTRGQLRDLGTLGGDFSAGSGINDRGQVVGDSFIAGNSADHAFLYSGGQMQDLGTLGGNSVALRINEHGQVVGYSYPDPNFLDYHAFLYTAGRMMDLGTLAGSSRSQANDINNRCQIVGTSFAMPLGNPHDIGFLYVGGRMQDLNSLLTPTSGWIVIAAYGINDCGQIAAAGTLNGGPTHALLLNPVLPRQRPF